MIKFIKNNRTILGVSLIFFMIRLIMLEQAALLHDERDIVLTGYSLAKTGRDLAGNWLPLNFPDLHPKTPFFSIYFSAFSWLFIPFRSVFFARFPFVLIASLLPWAIYECIKAVTKDKKIALATSIILSFNPWVLHLSRLALEINIVLPATIAAIAYYVNGKRKPAYLLLSIVFFTYQGFRVLVPLIVAYLIFFEKMTGSDKAKIYKSVFVSIVLLVGLITTAAMVDGSTTTGRLSELIFFQKDQLAADVTFKRNTSVSPIILQKIFHNKATAALDYMLGNFTRAQDLTFLFKEGDSSPINGSASAGQFLFPFILLYYAGYVFLGKKGNFRLWYPVGFILIGFVPSLLSGRGPSFAIRSAFSALGYAYLIACGSVLFIGLMGRMSRIGRIAVYGFFGFSLVISFTYFAYNYFFRRPVFASESFFEHERSLSKYLETKRGTITVYHPYPNDGYFSYMFYNHRLNVADSTPDFANKKTVTTGGVSFSPCPPGQKITGIKPAIYAEACLSLSQYDVFEKNGKVIKIPYQDFSRRNAYFIVE